MKHLLDLTSLGNDKHSPRYPFINSYTLKSYAVLTLMPDNSYDITLDGYTLFTDIDEVEAKLIVGQINDWIKTFITAEINLRQPIL